MSLSRPILQYPEDKLTQALDAIRNGMKIREASRLYSVPRGTLQDRLHFRVPEGPRKMGPDSILSKSEETEIANWLITLADCGFPLKSDNLLNTVQNIMIEDGRPNPFTNGRPGKKWLQSFFRRNPLLSLRTPEAISKGRAIITEESIRKWFDNLKKYLISIEALDLLEDPQRIFNGDETSFIICPKTGKVIAPRGYKNVYQIVKGKEKEAITVLAFFSANGDILPPCVVFPYIRPPKDVVNSMPDSWFLGKSDTGWMKADVFFDYVSKCLNKWIQENNIKKPVLVFVDGHKSHMTMGLSQYCYDNNIILYALPPNTTHLMQPADVSVFKPLKSEWTSTIHEWCSQPDNLNSVLTKATFCPLLDKVLQKSTLIASIKNGFRKCSLFPFNPDAVDYSKCIQNNLENSKAIAHCSKKSPFKTLKKKEFDTATKIIKHISKDLTACGISVEVVLQVIENAKLYEGLNDSIKSNTTENENEKEKVEIDQEKINKIDECIVQKDIIESKKNQVNEVQELLLENRVNKEKIHERKTTEEIILIKSTGVQEDNNIYEDVFTNSSQQDIQANSYLSGLSLPLGDVTFMNNLLDDELNIGTFEINENSILMPITEKSGIQDNRQNVERSLGFSALTDSMIQRETQRISPIVRKHLVIPSPIKKSSTHRNMNRIGAISSSEWRLFENKRGGKTKKERRYPRKKIAETEN
ncbi:unnamed protein product, partial [Brenthis ino]